MARNSLAKPTPKSGDRIGRLTLIERTPQNGVVRATWRCVCDCGNTRVVQERHLKTGATQSCGCRLIDFGKSKRTHGATAADADHGTKRLFGIWVQMRARCENEANHAYQDYGGRGIRVCSEWSDFAIFAMDMGPRPKGLSLERLDNDKGYSPDNCVWGTKKQQANNRRSNRTLTFDGITRTLSGWSDITGISQRTLWQRLDSGWSIEDTLTKKVRIRNAS